MKESRLRSAGLLAGFRRRRRGSVLVIVMVTLLFATFALVNFMEKASVDLLVDQREILSRRLRHEAYNALEMTLGVLNEFREAGNGLRSPAEGWGDPLEFAGYVPGEDRTISVSFDDESGKLPLPRMDAQMLVRLFRYWELPQAEAESVADALLGWMKRDHVYTSAVQPDYDAAPIPYEVPGRSLRSYGELAAIDKVREVFFDADGRPNDLWRRFVDSVSLFDFARPNLNGARPDTLAALGQFDDTQQRNLGDYLRGAGLYQNQGPRFFRSPNEAQAVAGPAGDTGAFEATISALRITVTVREGTTEYRLSTVIAPQGGARTIQTTASDTRRVTQTAGAQTAAQRQSRPNAAQANPRPGATPGVPGAAATPRNLQYPFTLLEIQENDAIPPPPLPPPNPLI